jgi:Tol biopolymer transport system component
MTCEVVYFAVGRGICLKAKRGVFTRYTAELFSAQFERLATVPLAGIPSRTRISPDGRLAAVTVFMTGHSYSSVDFTTQTLLLDVPGGQVVTDLEQLAVMRDGQRFEAKDFNFWGVTFTGDSRRFYCTVSSNRRHYLLEGEIATRQARVIHENVECPSLSPDGKRVAYKKRMPGNQVVWQLHVLDLATAKETPLAENRSVDDQIEWLDFNHVLYSLPQSQTTASAITNVWMAKADGSESPRLFLANAYSPAVVR